MAKSRILAFDAGATSARVMAVDFDGEKIELQELHRFDNTPRTADGTLYWDMDILWGGLKKGIKAANGEFESIGIDTWGVDFALLDKDGNIIAEPVHYRDSRTDGIMEDTFKVVPKEELYAKTGIQFMQFNTVFQLYYLKTRKPELLEKADKMIFMPDLFYYLLTGEAVTERSIASTSGLLDAKTGDWDYSIIDKLGIKRGIFGKITDAGAKKAPIKKELWDELGIKKETFVISVLGHDTASAVASVPSVSDNIAYISSGTWSLLGTELLSPILSDQSFSANYTNESGYNRSIRYLKNIMGLWIINEYKRNLEAAGEKYSYGELAAMAAAEPEDRYILDVDDDLFLKPGNMPGKIKEYFTRQNKPYPETVAATARCVYDSLAKKYSEELKNLSYLTGKKFDTLNIIGGGTKAEILSQKAAKACKIHVTAGPIEATVIGNAAVQLIALGKIKDLKAARLIIKDSFPLQNY